MEIVCNAFSLQMVDRDNWSKIRVIPIGAPSAERLKAAQSAVGHADTAAVLGVACNRINVKLKEGDVLLVAQLTGGRLPEGATTLPEGFSFSWAKVFIR
ncbi:MAG: DUF1874 domain-containing protein [Actinomycetaceae bacterium]|nr:DUF1874 domain-containing protein [Actinomycetaceae bacterium]